MYELDQPIVPLDILQKWPGLKAFYAEFEALGYSAHRCYIDMVRATELNPEYQDSLMLYWEELARELLSSGGLGHFRSEFRKHENHYCSPLLDALEKQFFLKAIRGDMPFPPHPLVTLYTEQRFAALRGGMTPDAPNYFDPQTRVKVAEYNRMGLSATEWDGKAKAFAAIFKEKALALGFARGKPADRFGKGINRLWFHRTSPAGINFHVGYPTLGSIAGVGGRLPFYFWTSKPGLPAAMQFLTLPAILPGLEYYMLFHRILYPMAYYGDIVEMGKCATIGIQAVLQAYRLLIDSL